MTARPDHHTTEPEFEGRPMARPDAELVDQGLAFDLGTLFSRRRMLTFLGVGALGVGVAACGKGSSGSPATTAGSTTTSAGATSTSASAGSTATTAAATPTTPTTSSTALTEIPDETAGPYPGDGSNGPDILEQSGVIRSDIRTSIGEASGVAGGVPINLEVTVLDMANGNVPYANAAVYVWHCTREGGYSMYSSGVEDENFLRGVQVADANGTVTFTSVFPACYDGRWPHIHFEVYPDAASITDSTSAIATSQLALPQDACETVYAETGYEASVSNLARVSLSTDGVFGDDGAATQLPTVSGDVSRGYDVKLTIGVDTTTTPSGGSMGGPGGPPRG